MHDGSVAVRPREGIADLARDARWELMMLDPGSAEFRSLAVTAAAHGIVVRSVVPNPTLLAPMAAAEVGRCVDRGVRVRSVAAVPAGMVILDRRSVVVPGDDGAAVLSDRGSVTLLSELFERTWMAGLPFGPGRRRPSRPIRHSAPGLTEQQAAAVQLLAAGHTDDAIAKRLGVSPRTARRIANTLMDRLGARGRFQAGVHAVRAGWLA